MYDLLVGKSDEEYPLIKYHAHLLWRGHKIRICRTTGDRAEEKRLKTFRRSSRIMYRHQYSITSTS